VLNNERPMILLKEHEEILGHCKGREKAQKIFCTGLWWPTLHKDAKEYF
jgi:hypothetical protein